MAAVTMHIDKFGKEVTIDENHPLAIAQRAKDAKPSKKSAKTDEVDDDPSPSALSKMNLTQLREHAEGKNISVPEDASKKEIIALIEALAE
jgi:hypothetical protein